MTGSSRGGPEVQSMNTPLSHPSRKPIAIIDQRDAPRGGASPRWLLVAPHRLFFAVAMLGLVAISLWWLLIIGARAIGAPLLTVLPPSWLHGWAMANGFMPALMFGFLFTAGPKWLHVETPPTRALAGSAALSLAGLLLALAGAFLHVMLVIAGALAMALGWALLLARFAQLIISSRFPDQVHARVVLTAFAIGVAAHLVFVWGLWQLSATWVHSAQMLTIWLFLAPIFITVAHRLIPFFTASVVPTLDAWRPLWLLAAMNGVVIAHALLPLASVAAPSTALTVLRLVVDLGGAALLLFVTWRWGLVQSLRNRLLAMLHLSFVWLGLALLLYAWQQAVILAGLPQAGLGLAPLHALTMGFFSALMFAMVTRVTAGHSGRQLLADSLTWALFWTLQAAVLLRVLVDAAPSAAHWLTLLAIGLWCAALLPWALRNLALYVRPRADGRPG